MSRIQHRARLLLLSATVIILAGFLLFRTEDVRRILEFVRGKPMPCEVTLMDVPYPRSGLGLPERSVASRPLKKNYRFSEDWFSWNKDVWWDALGPLAGRPDLQYLEIGLFEGQSALWMAENILTDPSSHVTGIDPFLDEESERVFHENLELLGQIDRFTVIKGFSQKVLPRLEPSSFDIIYIDGSHTADDVLADAVMSWELLKDDGLVIFDDYGWQMELPSELRPMVAIEAFITAYRNRLEVIHRGYQVVVRKVRAPTCASKQFCSRLGDQHVYYWRTQQLSDVKSGEVVSLSPEEIRLVEKILVSRRFGADARTFVPEDLDPLRGDPGFGGLVERLGLEL